MLGLHGLAGEDGRARVGPLGEAAGARDHLVEGLPRQQRVGARVTEFALERHGPGRVVTSRGSQAQDVIANQFEVLGSLPFQEA